jgi:SAM-dependent methyltransferase
MENEHQKASTSSSEYWDNRYLANETEWDMHQVSPPLKSYIDNLSDKELAILIPGCGNAYEAKYLLDEGFKNVTLIDLSKIVTDRLKEQYKNESVQIVNENFFDHQGQYDLILEQTFFCALSPDLREKYVEKSYELLNDHGKIAGVFFNKSFTDTQPPYVASDNEYRELFQPTFTFLKFENCTNSIAPRMGNELAFEFEKK